VSHDPARATERAAGGRTAGVGAFIWEGEARVRAAAARRNGCQVECGLRGGSMEPSIPARSRIRITFGEPRFRTGEVVAFMAGGRVVAHRVAYRAFARRTWLVTRGDARLLPDPPIEAGCVLGRVTAVDSGTGWRAPGQAAKVPRRERLLAFVLLGACAALLELDARVARRFAHWLAETELRSAWTRTLLY
jgi:hypothetical protein